MKKRVLWLDNDLAYVETYREAIEKQGIFAKAVATITDAIQEINSVPKYDVLILDVMIPTKSEDEEKICPPLETNSGLKTGLVFYRRMKERLKQHGTRVMVMTVRLDKGIQEEFKAEGLPENLYYTKMTLREIPLFIATVKELLNSP